MMAENRNRSNFRSGYIALIGAPNVGKSTLLNRILNEKISITAPKPQTTRNRVLGILTRPDCQVIFIDTPGIHKARDSFNRSLVETAYSTLNEVDAVCLIIDAADAGRGLDLFIIEKLKELETPVILAINKIDLLPDKRELLPLMGRFGELMDFRAVVPISALRDDGIPELLVQLTSLLAEGPQYFPSEYLTDQPERFLVSELVREQVFRLLQQEIPYAVAVLVERFEEDQKRNIIEIEATINVERDSQKAIIIGKGGSMLKEIGSRARLEIEALLGSKIYLGLFVKVQKNWRNDPRALTDFGYNRDKS